MSWTGLLEFTNNTITDYSRPLPCIESNSSDLQNSNSSVSEFGESSESIMSKPMIKFVKAADSPIVIKSNKTETARKPAVKYAEMYRNTTKSPRVRGNQRNWNNLMNQRLASNFEFKNKVCYECGSFDHLIKDCSVHQKQEMEKQVWNNARRVNHQNKLTCPHPKRNFVPALILTKSGQVLVNAAKQSSYKAATSVSAARRVNTTAPRPNVNSARPKTTHDLMIIKLIQRVKRLERELKARTSPTKIQKVDVRGRSSDEDPTASDEDPTASAFSHLFAILVDDKSEVTGIKILDDLEKRIEKVEIFLNKAKEKMLLKKGNDKMMMEREVIIIKDIDDNPFQVTSDESSDDRIERLTNELEELKKEKEGLDSKLIGFESASKDLDTLLGSQRSDKNKKDDTITDYSRPSPSIKSNSSDLQNSNSSVSESGESSESIMSKPMIKFVKAADSPTVIKSSKTKTARKPRVKYAEMYRNTTKSPKVRGHQRNWNNLMNQRLASNFEFKNKVCYECGSFDHLIKDYSVHRKQEMEKQVWNNARRVNHQNKLTCPHPKRTFVPAAILTKSGQVPVNAAKQSSHKAAASVSAARRVNTAAPRPNVNSARPNTTQDLMIIELIQRVKRLEKELKARTLPTKIQKFDVRGRSRSVMAWVPKKDQRAFNSRNLIEDAASSLGEDCWDQIAFNLRNLIEDAASSLGEDC
uniref:Retrotransposon Orf1 n=1 Tax=Tanacetum cinerariifolium TaxID=118510 RepID=A0A699HIA2_TANCI|nr:retrotransposon Orf1 [Tanacetum cinerariifolium]